MTQNLQMSFDGRCLVQNDPLTPRTCIRIGITLIGVWWISVALKQFVVAATMPRSIEAIARLAVGDFCVGGLLLFVAKVMKA